MMSSLAVGGPEAQSVPLVWQLRSMSGQSVCSCVPMSSDMGYLNRDNDGSYVRFYFVYSKWIIIVIVTRLIKDWFAVRS